MPTALASRNALTCSYAGLAREFAHEAQAAATESESRDRAVAALTMAVAFVEAYVNVFARLWLDQNPVWPHRAAVEQDLRTQKSLGRKLEEWPMLFFGKSVDFGSGLGQRFKAVLITRNRLMHFLPDTHDFAHEGVVIRGLINVSDYNALSGAVAVDAVNTAEAFVGHLLFMQGLSPARVQHALHHWLGRVPGAA